MTQHSYWESKTKLLHHARDLAERKGDPIENIRKVINFFYTAEYIEYGNINHNSLLVAKVGIAVKENKLVIMIWP